MDKSIFFEFAKSNLWAGALGGVIVPTILLFAFFPGNVWLLSIILILLVSGGIIGLSVGILFGFPFSFLAAKFHTQQTLLYKVALVVSVTLSFVASPIGQFALAMYLIFGKSNSHFYS